jgi:glutamate 5-kinase
MKNCISILLANGIIPIINENDVVSVTELMFTDNDELAGLVASMLNVDSLILLTSVDGIFGMGENGEQKLIEWVGPGEKNYEKHVSTGRSAFGKGGMLTKAHMARKVADAGIEVIIANGFRNNILLDLKSGKAPGTVFQPSSGKSNIKKWLSHSKGFEKGALIINEGALAALRSRKAASLLPVGVVKVEGHFKKGDIITIFDLQKNQIGLGISRYDDAQTREKLGKKNQRPLIHYDYLFLL